MQRMAEGIISTARPICVILYLVKDGLIIMITIQNVVMSTETGLMVILEIRITAAATVRTDHLVQTLLGLRPLVVLKAHTIMVANSKAGLTRFKRLAELSRDTLRLHGPHNRFTTVSPTHVNNK